MLDQRLRDTIDTFLKPDYIEVIENECELWEKREDGRTKLNVHLPSAISILCIRDNDNKPKCGFLNSDKRYGLSKSIDHVLLIPNSRKTWTAHLIEMKTSVGHPQWRDIGLKTRSTILNMKAIASVLDISIDTFKVYTTYDRLCYSVSDPTNIVGRKTKLGINWKVDEWDKNKLVIDIPVGENKKFLHKGIKMKTEVFDDHNTLCGELTLA